MGGFEDGDQGPFREEDDGDGGMGSLAMGMDVDIPTASTSTDRREAERQRGSRYDNVWYSCLLPHCTACHKYHSNICLLQIFPCSCLFLCCFASIWLIMLAIFPSLTSLLHKPESAARAKEHLAL